MREWIYDFPALVFLQVCLTTWYVSVKFCITATGSKVAINVFNPFNNSYPSGNYSFHLKLLEVSMRGNLIPKQIVTTTSI